MEKRVPKPLIRELRAKMRDYQEVNYLEEKEESQDEQYARILWESVEDLNLTGPIFVDKWTFENIPEEAIRLVIDMAVVRALREVTVWMARNKFEYQAGNTTVRLYDRYRDYLSIIGVLGPEVERKATNWKMAENSNRAWGANLTEMFDGWRNLDPADWVVVQI